MPLLPGVERKLGPEELGLPQQKELWEAVDSQAWQVVKGRPCG